jgi:arylformamidase
MPIYDITRTIAPSLKVWPGDTPFSARQLADITQGASVNLFTLTLSGHTGTHADAWFHYRQDGLHPAQMPLDAYVGPARLVTVEPRDGPLQVDDFPAGSLENVERLLIRSHVSQLPDSEWPEEFPYPAPQLIDYVAVQGCRLIGLDSPSFDDLNSATLPGHQRLFANGMVNLETLRFIGMPDGDYELIALPLRIADVCGSPVRAILRG